jgi:hypothetical protein
MDTTPGTGTTEAFYIRPKSGGFQLMRLTLDSDIVTVNEPISDPDAWNQIMSELEHELSKRVQ